MTLMQWRTATPWVLVVVWSWGIFGLPPSVTAATYTLASKDIHLVGQLQRITARDEDTLVDIARQYNLGYQALRLANPSVDPWLPGEGTSVLLPTRYILPQAPRDGIVVNLAEMRIYYYPKPRAGEAARVVTFPVSIGRGDWQTPLGVTKITDKVRDPIWYPPQSIRLEHAESGDPLPAQVPPGPDNPLGRHALLLGMPGYLIHGTNKRYGIGMKVSHGCIRLYPEDIETLFREVPLGTAVHIVDQPYKVGWDGGLLYLEAHPALGDGRAQVGLPRDFTSLVRSLIAATQDRPDYKIDWKQAEDIVLHSLGIPIAVYPDASLVYTGIQK